MSSSSSRADAAATAESHSVRGRHRLTRLDGQGGWRRFPILITQAEMILSPGNNSDRVAPALLLLLLLHQTDNKKKKKKKKKKSAAGLIHLSVPAVH